MILWLIAAPLATPTFAQPEADAGTASATPLATKEQMIRDRYQRFEDRLYRLREQLAETEPENAARLARAMERSGELALADRLEIIINLLNDPSQWQQAADAQSEWMEQADQLLGILLARDSDNEERREDIERLERYRREVDRLRQEQHALRDAAAEAAVARRMQQQLDQAIRRLEQLQQRQQGVTEDANAAGKSGDEAALADKAQDQQDVARDTGQLAEDVDRLSKMPEDPSAESTEMQAARAGAQAAAEAMQEARQAAGEAGEALQQADAEQAAEKQQAAEQKLQEAREKLQEAREALAEKASTPEATDKQSGVAQQTGDLSKQMKQDAAGEGQQGQQGKQSPPGQPGQSKSPPGSESLDRAQQEMDGAAEQLGEDQPERAVPPQDRALEELDQAARELEEEIDKLRKEERAEMLRDLESRFREMLSKQKVINESTTGLNMMGRDNFKRPEELQLADLSTRERALAQQAARCLHILEEDATTVVFPRVVAQLAEDMDIVADRLALLNVGEVTRRVQKEIVETLEQLLESVQRMQQENEQQGGQGQSASGENQQLLPTSAELKLLRASQVRVNDRTSAIAQALEEGSESVETGNEALQTVAGRQRECAEIAREMRDRQRLPH